MLRKLLLVCGILSSPLYVGADVLAAMRYEGYSYASQTVSELSAIGAPSRPLIVPLYLTYSVLMIAFALGVWGSVGRNRGLRVVAGLLVGYGAFGFVGPFTSMNQRAVLAAGGGTLTDTLHIISAMVAAIVGVLWAQWPPQVLVGS
jgi:hypothetical protein